MKIQKGHYVPKELITSDAVHEAVVKCFVAAGFVDERPYFGQHSVSSDVGLGVYDDGTILWTNGKGDLESPLTLQQLFTAENGPSWPDWANCIIANEHAVYFNGGCLVQFISGSFIGAGSVLATRQPKEGVKTIEDAVIELDGGLV